MNQIVLYFQKITTLFLILGVLTLVSCAEKEQKTEIEIPASAITEKIMSLLMEKYPGLKISEVEIESDSILRYELEGKVGDKKYELDILPDGTISEIEYDEIEIPVSAVPEKVISAAKQKFPGIEITEAEIESDQSLHYEIEGQLGDKEYEIKIDSAGIIFEIEQEVKKEKH